MNLWNTRNLSMPPINTFKASNTNIDIKHLKNVFQEGKQFFDNENHMKAEYTVLSTVFYRTKQKFRSAKDFKSLERVYKALSIYFKNNISYDLQCFMDLIPTKYTDETYLPNKNLVDYILVRLQGLVKLLERIVEMCKVTALLFDKRLNTGHFWKIGFIIFSMVSRLYILTKYSAKFICNFYNKVLPFSHKLKNNGRDWLPKDYILPNDLQQWVNVDWLDIDDELQIIEISTLPDITQFFDLIGVDDDEIEFCDEYIMVDNESDIEDGKPSNNVGSIKQDITKLRGFNFDDDIGQVIEVKDDDSFSVADKFSQVYSKTNNIQNKIISDSLSRGKGIHNINTGEVIEIEDGISLPHSKLFTQALNENSNGTVTSDNSLICNVNENSFDMGEVIEVSNSPEVFTESLLTESETGIANFSNQSIIILDDSFKSEDINSREKISDTCKLKQSKRRQAKTKKMKLTQKKWGKNNVEKSQLYNSSTFKSEASRNILGENEAKNVTAVSKLSVIQSSNETLQLANKRTNRSKKVKRSKQKPLKTTTNGTYKNDSSLVKEERKICAGIIHKPYEESREWSLPNNNWNGVIHKENLKRKKSRKKKSKLLNNIVQTIHQTDNLKHIVNKVHDNPQSLKINLNSKKKKNKQKKRR